MKIKNLILPTLLILTSFSSLPVHAYEEASKVQRSMRDMIKLSPEVREHVDRAMKLFRDKEKCGTAKESKRTAGSKSCADLLTFEKAEAANAAELKACQEKCSAGAAGAIAAKSSKLKGAAANELTTCVDQACTDECAHKEMLFKIDLDQFLRGSMGESLEMRSFFKMNRATIQMNN